MNEKTDAGRGAVGAPVEAPVRPAVAKKDIRRLRSLLKRREDGAAYLEKMYGITHENSRGSLTAKLDNDALRRVVEWLELA